MMAAINQLPATFKEVILLHYYQGMNIAEIAQMLELPEGTISSRLSRGRKKLESILLKGGDARRRSILSRTSSSKPGSGICPTR